MKQTLLILFSGLILSGCSFIEPEVIYVPVEVDRNITIPDRPSMQPVDTKAFRINKVLYYCYDENEAGVAAGNILLLQNHITELEIVLGKENNETNITGR